MTGLNGIKEITHCPTCLSPIDPEVNYCTHCYNKGERRDRSGSYTNIPRGG